jgi:hypothetical protein
MENMHYFVLITADDYHVVYKNHREEYISVSVCNDEALAQKHADLLNHPAAKPTSSGNKYLRRYMK